MRQQLGAVRSTNELPAIARGRAADSRAAEIPAYYKAKALKVDWRFSRKITGQHTGGLLITLQNFMLMGSAAALSAALSWASFSSAAVWRAAQPKERPTRASRAAL